MTVTITLKKPVEVAGETLSELNFRDVTTKDIRECGMPFTLTTSGNAQIMIDANAIANYVHKLAKIPPSTVDKLCPADFLQCQGVVMSFFE